MSEIQLNCGRKIRLTRFAMQPTFLGHMEGSPESLTRHVVKRLEETCTDMLAPAKPLLVLRGPQAELPALICVARYESGRGVQSDDPDYRSFLYVCWFVDNTNESIDEMSRRIAPMIDWNGNAEEYDVMMF